VIRNYNILRKLGAGSMGEVWLAEDTRLGRQVAIKMLAAELAADEEQRLRFEREARSASALSHPNVCTIHEIGVAGDGRPFIAMEFVEGRTLEARLAEGPLSIGEVVDIAIQVGDALDAAHAKGIVHRDIKPANISIDARGRVKVLDFGLAKRLGGEGPGTAGQAARLLQTQEGMLLGTPAFMSPEQALTKPADHRSDLFSLGAVLYNLLTGRVPFAGTTSGEVLDKVVHAQPPAIARFNYDVPLELERITLKLLAKDPERRFQSARDLLVDLKSLRQTLESGAAKGPGGGTRGPADEEPPPADAPIGSETLALGGAGARAPGGPPALRAAPPPASAASLEQLKKSDVIISYSHLDDQPLTVGKPGWVSQFQHHMEVRLRQLSGDRVQIWRAAKLSPDDVLEPQTLACLPSGRAMVSVLSPPFVRSTGCRQEVRAFLESGGGLKGADRSRLLKVIKTPVPDLELGDLANVFRDCFSYEFFDSDPVTGRVREFDEVFGDEARQRYYERVYDLAYEINKLLKTDAPPSVGSGKPPPIGGERGKVVYLAATTSDLQEEHDSVRRELLEQGFHVVPEKPLPMVLEELEKTVREYLARSDFVVHLVGKSYGLVPENARHSVLQLQAEWSAARTRESKAKRFIWVPSNLEVSDERQVGFLDRLRQSDAAEPNTELVEGSLALFKELLARGLVKQEVKAGRDAGAPPQVYVICDQEDEASIEALEDYLFAQGLEVCLPDFDGDQEQVGEIHRENLRHCDAVLIYYGNARKAWIDIKLRDLLKASGYGRLHPFRARAVYVGPPEDRRKERFKSHVTDLVIRQRGESFSPSPDLEALISRIRSGQRVEP
jgi:serine/threonine protein kinase